MKLVFCAHRWHALIGLFLIAGMLTPSTGSSTAIVANPPVGTLSWNTTDWNERADILFTAVVSNHPQHPSEWSWQFSGCNGELSPTSSTAAGPVVIVRRSGIIHAEVEVKWWNGTSYTTENLTADITVIGGPITISNFGRSQEREGRILGSDDTVWQPSILEYFDYDLKVGVPADAQPANYLQAEADWPQPSGTRLIWQLSGPVAFLEAVTNQSTSCKVYATAQSARAGAQVTLRYEYDSGQTYSATDTSDGAKSQTSGYLDQGYRHISCHRPKELLDLSPISKQNVLQGSFPAAPNTDSWVNVDKYRLRLWSWVGDPFAEVWVQERFPNGVPTQWDDGSAFDVPFNWNGTTGGHWTTVITSPNAPLYDYGGNLEWDNIGFSWKSDNYTGAYHGGPRPVSGGVPALSFVHSFYAGTKDTTNGGPTGVLVGTYAAECFTDGTTHVKQ